MKIILVLLILAAPLFGQDLYTDAQKAWFKVAAEAPRTLDRRALGTMRSVMPPQLAKILSEYDVELQVLQNPRYPTSLGFRDSNQELDPTKISALDLELGRYPFKLMEEVHGAAVLWNSLMRLASNGAVSEETARLIDFANRKIAYVTVRRNFPNLLEERLPQYKAQLFKERIDFLFPQFLLGERHLFIRFFGNEEDNYWIRSPVDASLRQATQTNRGDNEVGGFVSLDEISPFGVKIDGVIVKKISRIGSISAIAESVLPAKLNPSEDSVSGETSCTVFGVADGVIKPFTEKREATLELQRPFHGNIFAPRALYQLEVASKDPFQASTVFDLYIDTENFLPAYRVNYNSSGVATQLVVYAFAATGSNVALLKDIWIIDIINGELKRIDIISAKYCSKSVDNTDAIYTLAAVR